MSAYEKGFLDAVACFRTFCADAAARHAQEVCLMRALCDQCEQLDVVTFTDYQIWELAECKERAHMAKLKEYDLLLKAIEDFTPQAQGFGQVNDFDVYQVAAQKTEPQGLTLTNAVLGLCGEAGEVAELLKKVHYHGKTWDNDDMAKELGDMLWYLSAAARCCGTTLADIARLNVEKLKARYPDGFVMGGGVR